MSSTEKFLMVVVCFVTLLNVAECAVQVQEGKHDTACVAVCAPMAYTGHRDDDGCWCRTEDPAVLRKGGE